MARLAGVGGLGVVGSSVGAVVLGGALFGLSSCGASDSVPQSSGTGGASATGGAATEVASGGAAVNATGGAAGSTGGSFTVGENASVCSDDGLLFKPPGCSCTPGTPAQACWTGPPADRNRGRCHDGTQQCVGDHEIGQWGPCEGQTLLCEWPGEKLDGGDTAKDSGPPDCTCVPGVKIGCSEDCEALIICSLSGYKTCQPDGTWGPCRETGDILNAVGNVLGCRNVFHACALGTGEGLFTGDCSQAFTCGKVPGSL